MAHQSPSKMANMGMNTPNSMQCREPSRRRYICTMGVVHHQKCCILKLIESLKYMIA